jgi:hypothetical protein
MNSAEQLREAVELADQAAAALTKLKVAVWDSLQAMA